MVEKIEKDVDRLLLVSKMKEVTFQQNLSKKFVSITKLRVVYLHSLLSSLPFPKF